jgi:2-polyprenyl-3-methyl-5-hydroxy-6-metoxy-1,4-benzoquinol methylase
MTLLEEIDIYKNYICDSCSVVYSECDASLREDQSDSSLCFYKYNEKEIKEIPLYIKGYKDIIFNSLILNIDIKNIIFLEIGHGRGLSLIAASELGFKKVIGIDYNCESFEETKKHYKVKDNVFTYTNIKHFNEKTDILFMWHKLEHIEYPNEFLKQVAKKLNDNCTLFLQVPEYKDEYLCTTHYYYYNDKSIKQLLENNSFKMININHDIKNKFLTVLAKYNKGIKNEK